MQSRRLEGRGRTLMLHLDNRVILRKRRQTRYQDDQKLMAYLARTVTAVLSG